jgi:hypothetical protein
VRAKEALERECLKQGRDYDRIIKGRLASIIFTEDVVHPGDRHQVIREKALEIGADTDELIAEHEVYVFSYVGPVSGCAEALLERNVDLGIQEIVMCIDTFNINSYERTMEGLRAFAREVIPDLRAH